jgi:RNase P protein component
VEAASRADELAIKEKQMQIDAAFKADKLSADQQREGTRMGVDIAKHKAQLATQRNSQPPKKPSK